MKPKSTLDQQFIRQGRKVRFTNFVDAASIAFEKEARQCLSEASLDQQLAYLNETDREFYLLQVRGHDDKPSMQACVYVGRAKFFPGFGMASVPNLAPARSASEEEFGLKILAELMNKIPGVMTLRLQPQRYESESLAEFQNHAKRVDYFYSDPIGPTRTLMLELMPSSDELLKSLPQKTRHKIRHASKSRAHILELTRPECMEICETAMNASRKRSGGGVTDFDFKAPFALARKRPEMARILGLYLDEKWDQPLAYVIGYVTGTRAEFASAGAFGDSALRSIPYNYFLLWELMNWARSQGAREIDLGGITDGGPNDPLQGIARFKRSFSEREIEIGLEMVKIIRPFRFAVYSALKSLMSGFRWKNPVQPGVRFEPKPMGMLPTYD
jgi:hypothetical protein